MSIEMCISFTESYAHLQGRERQLLPVVDAARAEHDALLAALHAIIEEAGPSFGQTDGPGTINRISYAARQAIAKATGETHEQN